MRYERERPGELVHVDVKKLGRIVARATASPATAADRAAGRAGWQYLFVAIDDASRLGFARSTRRDRRLSHRLPRRARPLLRLHGVTVERVLTDNGNCFKRRWAEACAGHHGVRKTRPYRPQTNGKAERFIRTLLERWAYAYSTTTKPSAGNALPYALDFYNRFRPHRALGGQTPLQRVNNLSGTYT